LALWLRQFPAGEARAVAYEFVRRRLIFISAAEMDQLVGLSFPTLIRPWLMGMVSCTAATEYSRQRVALVATS
jgi:hypothetical protein